MKTEGKWTGPLEDLNGSPDDADLRKLTTVITTKRQSCNHEHPEPADALDDENIDNASQSTLPMKFRDCPSKIHCTVDMAFNGESGELSSFFHQRTCCVQISICTQASALEIVACLLDKGSGPNLVNNPFLRSSGAKISILLATLNRVLPPKPHCTSTVSYHCS